MKLVVVLLIGFVLCVASYKVGYKDGASRQSAKDVMRIAKLEAAVGSVADNLQARDEYPGVVRVLREILNEQ